MNKHSGAAANDAPFRGLAKSLGSARTVDEALVAAGLDWKVVPMPLLIQGRRENRPSRYKSLVRSDTAYEIAVATEEYVPVQNRDLLGVFFSVAEQMGVSLSHVGYTHGGAQVFASAEMEASFSLPVGRAWEEAMRRHPGQNWAREDRTVLQLLMTSGHEPGHRVRLSARAVRLVCYNGAKVAEDLGKATVVHRGNAPLRLLNTAEAIAKAKHGFQSYGRKAQVLRDAKSTRELDRAYVVNLLSPEAWRAIVAETEERVHGAHPGRLSGTDLLNAVIERTYTERFETALRSRSVRAVLDAIDTQPGAAMAAGTLWNTFNAVSYYVDHRSGRGADSGLQSSLFGEGDKLKTRALDLALEYAEATGARGVVNGQVVQ